MLTKPGRDQIRKFLKAQSASELSYTEVGGSLHDSPPEYDLDHNRIQLGAGQQVFDAACAALRRWEQFPSAWTEVHPAGAPLDVGTTVALLFRVFGLWWLSSARVVYAVNELQPTRRFGFAYGTLPGHIELGEERFCIEWLPDDTVWYDIRAFSRPRHWLVRLGYRIARRIQHRFVKDSQAAMRNAVAQAVHRVG